VNQLGIVGIIIVLVIAVRWVNGLFYKLARRTGYAAGRALGGRSSFRWLVVVGNLGSLAGTLNWLSIGAGLAGAFIHLGWLSGADADLLLGAGAFISPTWWLACVLYFALGAGQRVGETAKDPVRQETGLTDARWDLYFGNERSSDR
jgi:hypothetical protein